MSTLDVVVAIVIVVVVVDVVSVLTSSNVKLLLYVSIVVISGLNN